jgi:hypothetical protein
VSERIKTCKECGHMATEHRYRGGCDGIVDEVIAFSGDGPVFSQCPCSCGRSMTDVEEGF